MVVPFEKVTRFFFSFFVSISASELDNDPKPTCPTVDGGDDQKIPAMALAPESKDQTMMLGERTFNCCYPGEPQTCRVEPLLCTGCWRTSSASLYPLSPCAVFPHGPGTQDRSVCSKYPVWHLSSVGLPRTSDFW